jgi:hypothetical protein
MEWSEFLLSFIFWFNFIILLLALVSLLYLFKFCKVNYDRCPDIPDISFRIIVAYVILFTLRFLYVIIGQALPDNYIVNKIIFFNILNINYVVIFSFFVKISFLLKSLVNKRNESNLVKI